MSRAVCVACRHEIDSAAKLCPYCGADPRSGKKVDTQAMLQEVFSSGQSRPSTVLEFARRRQGVVIIMAIVVAALILGGVHQFVTRRNESAVSAASAVPLTEVSDLSTQTDDNKAIALPNLQFQFDGHSETMRTFVVEPGAVMPPEVVAAQQAAAQEAAAKKAAQQQAAHGQGPQAGSPAAAAQPKPAPAIPSPATTTH